MSQNRRNDLDKVYAERIHAKRRAEERLRVTLNRFDYADIVKQIIENRSVFVKKQTNRTSVHIVNVKGIESFAVYDRTRKAIVTFLETYEDQTVQQMLSNRSKPKFPESIYGKKITIPATWGE